MMPHRLLHKQTETGRFCVTVTRRPRDTTTTYIYINIDFRRFSFFRDRLPYQYHSAFVRTRSRAQESSRLFVPDEYFKHFHNFFQPPISRAIELKSSFDDDLLRSQISHFICIYDDDDDDDYARKSKKKKK